MILTIALFLLSSVGNFEAVVSRIEGSSAAAPLIQEALDEENLTGVRLAPSGTLRGIEALCSDPATGMAGASRPITRTELAGCALAGQNELFEVELGLGAIVLAERWRRGVWGSDLTLDLTELYLATAAMVPAADGAAAMPGCTLGPNTARNWREIDRRLPNRRLKVYGPPPSSAARDLFIERALAEGARRIECLAELERTDPAAFERAIMPRRDGVWLDTGENDEALAAALRYNRDAVGIMGWHSFSRDEKLRAVPVEGTSPSDENIRRGSYPLARSLYLYVVPDLMNEPAARRLVRRLQPSEHSRRVRTYRTPAEHEAETPPNVRITKTP